MYRCVLLSRSPIGEDVPDDAVVSLADDEVEGLARRGSLAPASCARKLGATARDEGAEPQHHSVRRDAMRLPRAVPAHACDNVTHRNAALRSRRGVEDRSMSHRAPTPPTSLRFERRCRRATSSRGRSRAKRRSLFRPGTSTSRGTRSWRRAARGTRFGACSGIDRAAGCVEINQHNRHHAIEQASRRWR